MTTVVKLSYNDDIRRITFANDQLTVTQLLKTAFNFFPELQSIQDRDIVLKYKDSDDDWISVTSQPELQEALVQIPSGSVLRLFVTLQSKRQEKSEPKAESKPESTKPDANPQAPDFDQIGTQATNVLTQFGVPPDQAQSMVNEGISFVRAVLEPQEGRSHSRFPFSAFVSNRNRCGSSCGADRNCSTPSCGTPSQPSTENPVCTYATNGSDYITQPWFNCLTCGLARGEGCCAACARTCHAGHTVIYRGISPAYCDCGAGSRGPVCKSSPQSETATQIPVTKESPKERQEERMEEEKPEEEKQEQFCEREESQASHNPFEEKLKSLEEMGFNDRSANIRALVNHRGDINGAIAELVNGYRY